MEVKEYDFSESAGNKEMDLSFLDNSDSDAMNTDIESCEFSDEDGEKFDSTGCTAGEQATITFFIIPS